MPCSPHPVMTVLGAGTAILTAAYLLWCFQRIYLGPLNERYRTFRDLSFREGFTLVPLAIIVAILGWYPHAVLGLLQTSLNHLNQIVVSTVPAQPRSIQAKHSPLFAMESFISSRVPMTFSRSA